LHKSPPQTWVNGCLSNPPLGQWHVGFLLIKVQISFRVLSHPVCASTLQPVDNWVGRDGDGHASFWTL